MVLFSRTINWAKANWLLALVVIVGFVVRVLGVKPGVHHEGDEVFYGQAVRMILNKNLLIEPSLLGYPPLVYWIVLVSFVLFFIPLAWVTFAIQNFQDFFLTVAGLYKGSFGGMVGFEWIFKTQIIGHNWTNAMYWGRYLTALFGAGVIYLTYLVSVRFFQNKKIGLLSSLLVAFNYRMVLNSMVGFPDMYNAFFLLVFFLALSRLLKNPDLKSYLIVWITAAFSFLIKYQTYFLLPLLISHIYISLKSPRNFLSREAIVGGLVALNIVIAAHGQYFVNLEKVIDINSYEAVKYSFGTNNLNIFPISYIYHIGIGPILSISFLIGLILAFINSKTRFSATILTSSLIIFSYLYFYYTRGGYHTRNLISVFPILLMFSSVTFVWLYEHLRRVHLGLVVIFLLLVALKPHLVNDLITIKSYTSQTNYEKLEVWLQKNIPEGIRYGFYPGNPTPLDTKVDLELIGPVSQAFSYRELLAEKFDYITLDFTDVIGPNFLFWMNQPTRMGLKFWRKPDDLLSQNYMALATREYLWSHALTTFFSPWQTPGFSYAVIKIKSDQSADSTKFKKLESSDLKTWSQLFLLPEYKSSFETDTQGLKIKGNSIPGSVRWESTPQKILPNHLYKIVGSIKNMEVLRKNSRDGFLRIDFYKNRPTQSITARPLISFVSTRVYGEAEWHEIQIYAPSPSEANFMVVGFQSDSPSSFILKEVKIEESESEIGNNIHTVTIPDEIFFLPSLNGFL